MRVTADRVLTMFQKHDLSYISSLHISPVSPNSAPGWKSKGTDLLLGWLLLLGYHHLPTPALLQGGRQILLLLLLLLLLLILTTVVFCGRCLAFTTAQ